MIVDMTPGSAARLVLGCVCVCGRGAGPSRSPGFTQYIQLEVPHFGVVTWLKGTQPGLIGVRDRPPLQQPGQGCSDHDTLHGPLSRLHSTPVSRGRNAKGEGNHMDERGSEKHPAKAKAQEQEQEQGLRWSAGCDEGEICGCA